MPKSTLKFISLGSGSSGNCYYFNADGHGLLIDAGVNLRDFYRYFNMFGLSLEEVKDILITHDHADHVKSAGVISAALHAQVYALDDCFMGMKRNRFMHKKVRADFQKRVEMGVPFDLGPFHIEAFPVPHDSAACCGYMLTVGGVTFCIATDIGHVTDEIGQHIREAQYVIMESNYDADMLTGGSYPAFLKKRITNGTGHLSNDEAAKFLAETLTPATRHVWLCHLSEENNRPELAIGATRDALTAAGFTIGTAADTLRLDTLPRMAPTKLYEIEIEG